MHGVGVSCVNALSTRLVATVRRNGKLYRQEYSIGKPLGPVEEVGVSEETGTTIEFSPDTTIFTTGEYQFDILATRLRELAYLNKGIRLTLIDRRQLNENGEPRKKQFYSQEGFVITSYSIHYTKLYEEAAQGTAFGVRS